MFGRWEVHNNFLKGLFYFQNKDWTLDGIQYWNFSMSHLKISTLDLFDFVLNPNLDCPHHFLENFLPLENLHYSDHSFQPYDNG